MRYSNNPIRRYLSRLRYDAGFLRSNVQALFAILCIWIGIEFTLFMKWGFSGSADNPVTRPPGVDGFLPISALISLKHWILTGTINTIHPAGLFILIAIIATAFVAKKSFCSWLCPIGTLSESLWMLGQRLFGRNYALPRWLDIPLRSIKYLVLAFFGWAVWNMDAASLTEFIYGPYNSVADIKLFLFFAQMTRFALGVIIILMLLSLAVKNFWCRFLCPYGALLGAISWLSPFKVTRTAETCIDCELCTIACPSGIPVHRLNRVRSDECTGCLACVAVCPVKDTLEIRASATSRRIPPFVFGILVVALFVAITGAAMISGHWQNEISHEQYLRYFNEIESVGHTTLREPAVPTTTITREVTR